MKKNNLVLLTVLIMLVLYCGVVIFVTKPSDFAYEALFGNVDSSVKVPESEAPAVDRAELTAEMEAIALKYAATAVDQAVARTSEQIDKAVGQAVGQAVDQAVEQAGKNTDAAIRDAIGKINVDSSTGTVDVSSIVEASVRQAVAEAREDIIREAVSRATADIRSGKDDLVNEISDKGNADLLARRDAVVQSVTDQVIANVLEHEDEVVRSISDKVNADLQAREDAVMKSVTDSTLYPAISLISTSRSARVFSLMIAMPCKPLK